MRVTFSCVALAFALAAASPASAFPAGRVAKRDTNAQYKSNSYLVKFHGNASDDHFAQLRAMSGVAVNRHYTGGVFHGMSVSTDSNIKPNHLAGIDGVETVYHNRVFSLDHKKETVHGTSDILHEKTGLLKALASQSLNGTGVRIGIIDTGVDHRHPDLGACWKTEGCKWQFGQDLVGDEYDAQADEPIIKPNPTPVDCDGHGTHISGIIGATGDQVQGVAPGATLGMYRTFSCKGMTSDEVLLHALDVVAQDNVDILNLSLGDYNQADGPVSASIEKLVSKGVVVVAAAGNVGTNGVFGISSPGNFKGAITVGSVDNWKVRNPSIYFTSSAGSYAAFVGRGVYESGEDAEPPFVFDQEVPVVAPTDSIGSTLGCNPYHASFDGQVVMVDRGNCTFIEKVALAQDAGAEGVIVVHDMEMVNGITVDNSTSIPVVTIGFNDGQKVRQQLEQGDVTVEAYKKQPKDYPAYDVPTGGQMSYFSTYGPTAELALKPDVSAPGGFIWSTHPTDMGSYITYSGTSQAAPYITGVVALLKEARPELTVDEIHDILVSTAKPLTDENTGLKVTPFQSGGGLVNVYDALRARALIDPSSISINETAFETPTGSDKREAIRTLTIKNTDLEKTLHASLYHSVADSVTMWHKNGSLIDNVYVETPLPTWPPSAKAVDSSTLPQIRASKLAVDVAPGETTDIFVVISAPHGLDEAERWLYSGYAQFSMQWEGEDTATYQNVPYGGFNADLSKNRVIAEESTGVLGFTDMGFNPVPASDVRVSASGEFVFTYGLDTASRRVNVRYIDEQGQFAGYVNSNCHLYLQRVYVSGDNIQFYTLNGEAFKTCNEDDKPFNLTAGTYHIRLEALRAFGDPDNTDDYEVWDSDKIIVE